MNSNFSSEDSIKTEESSNQYVQGGYCCLDIGDTLMNNYFIIRKLGYGYSSTVWLCWDLMTRSYVAVKVMKGAAEFIQVMEFEVDLLSRTVSQRHEYSQYVVKYLDHMEVTGENGVHACIVFELAGQTLAEFNMRNRLNLNQVRSIVRQMLKGLYFLHEICDLVHTDLKLDNILILTSDRLGQELAVEVYEALNSINIPRYFTSNLPKDKRKFKQPSSELERQSFEVMVYQYHRYLQNEMERLGIVGTSVSSSSPYGSDSHPSWRSADSGDFFAEFCSFFRPRADSEKKVTVKIADLGYAVKNEVFDYRYIQARNYRAAEVILGGRLSRAIDIWSAACIAFQLATGELLFNDNIDDMEHIQRITQISGDIPQNVLHESERADEFFDSEGKLLTQVEGEFSMSQYLQMSRISESESDRLSDLLLSMLHWDPEKRLTAAQCLEHPWLN